MNEYTVIDGIKCYAPALAVDNEGFQKETFERLFELEENSFWFRARAEIIEFFFKKYALQGGVVDFLEIGCGTGFMLKWISRFPKVRLTGSEIHLHGLTFAQKRLPGIELIQMDACQIPFSERFDAVGAFDVLEHIDRDELVMAQVKKSLKPGGCFIVTVPQHQWMWSYADDYSCHKRRYSRSELRNKMTAQGFRVLYIGSFVFVLFPAMFLSRLLKGKKKGDAPMNEFQIPSFMNRLFYWMVKIDFLLIRMGISLPFGGSLICVARKV